jgi:hypothetical protein
MTELTLHHIWQFKLLNTENLKTIEGEPVRLKFPGIRNIHQGPDFSQAKVWINNTLWVGNVEIHINTSDWYKHKHQCDKNYQHIILHVVYNHDVPWNENIPLLELKNHIPEQYLENIKYLFQSGLNYCLPNWKNIEPIHINSMLHYAAIEKLETKKKEIYQILNQENNNWDDAFYMYFSRYFGMKVNNDAFYRLAKNTPLKVIEKHADNAFQIEALLFGQSGLLIKYSSSLYVQKLLKEYEFLKVKYNLKPLNAEIWKFSRMRPSSFPTVKIAQLASLLTKNARLFSKILQINSMNELHRLFKTSPSAYWHNHYTFGNESISKPKNISSNFIELLAINVVIPFVFTYSDYTGNDELKEKSLSLIETIKPETNALSQKVNNYYNLNNALQTQGLLYLESNYCQQKKCLNCRIGNKIIQN